MPTSLFSAPTTSPGSPPLSSRIDTPAEVLSAPASTFVATFLNDATIVAGTVTDGIFRACDHPLTAPLLGGDLVGDGQAEAAIARQDVRVVADPDGDGIVRSSLFTADGGDLVVDWAGMSFRVKTVGFRPAHGDRVCVEVAGVHAFRQGAATAAAPLVTA